MRVNRVSGAKRSMSCPGDDCPRFQIVFEPFDIPRASGTGLGLYITQQLVEKIGGRVAVESKVGEGTTFILSLNGTAQ